MIQKNTKMNFKTMIVVFILTIVTIFTSALVMFNQTKNKVYAIDWVDDILDSYVVESLGKAAPVYTVVTGTISLAGSVYKGVDAAVSAEDGDGVAAFFKAFIGGEDSAHTEIMNSLSDIKNSITEVSGKIDVINGKMTSLFKKLDGITRKLDSMLNTITTELQTSVEQIKVNLYTSQLEMRNWTTIYNQINDFYNKYADVKTTLQTDLKTLNDRHTNYEDFLQVAYSQTNGKEIEAVVNKIGLNYEKSYATLTDEEKTLLDTNITSNGFSSKVGKYISDYTTYLYNYLKNSYTSFASGYSTNMYMTFLNMADYIIGNKTSIGSGIGEVFYKLAIMGSSNSIEVHDSYKQFMSNILNDFMLTGYVCNLSLQMQANYLKAYNQNISEIQTYNDYVDNIKSIILKVLAYTDYEYQKCIIDYDINGFVPQVGYDVDDYIVYYGNTVNYLKNGDNQTRYVLKQNYSKNEIFVNESYVFLASGESFETKVYYHNKECQSNFEWVSSDQNVAIVSQNGVITGIVQGDAIISVKLKNSETLYPVVAVSVSNAYVTANGTENNVYDYGSSSFVCAGKGLTYNYGATIYAFANSFDTSIYPTTSISLTLGLNKTECEKFNFSTTNRNIQIDGDVAKTTVKTSGVITGVQNINGTKVVLQLPVVGEVALEPLKETLIEDTLPTDENTIYIYTKEQLLNWHDRLNAATSFNDEITKFNVKLMADIDFEWDIWETITSSYSSMKYKTFDGNGHEIKNITFKGATYYDGESIYGLFSIFSGTLQNLIINNVACVPGDNEDENTKRYYSFFGYNHYGYYLTRDEDTWLTIADGLSGDVYNCVLKGDAKISTTNPFVFSPFAGKVSVCDLTYGTYYSIVKYCIYDMNCVIDCQGADIEANMFGFYNEITLDWAYNENTNYYYHNTIGRRGGNNLFTGSMKVINIADTSKVKMDRFYQYDSDNNNATINKCLFYYSNSVCSATDTQGQTIEFSNAGRGNCVTYEQSLSSDFWTGRGFGYYDISDVIAPYSRPLTHKIYLHADLHNFKSVYALNEELDMANLRIYDRANTDITDLVQFSSIDKTTPGKKTITATYDSETISFEVEYVEYKALSTLTYNAGTNATGNGESLSIAPGVAITLNGAMFTRLGYTQIGWTTTDGGEKIYDLDQKNVTFVGNTNLYPVFAANTDIKYYVIHQIEDLTGEKMSTYKTETLYGSTDSFVTPKEIEIVGFEVDSLPSAKKINGDPDTPTTFVIKYKRLKYNIVWMDTRTGNTMQTDNNIKYGQSISYNGKRIENYEDNEWVYTFEGWDQNIEICDGHTEIKTVYSKELRDYLVVFLDDYGMIISSHNYHWGEQIVAPTTIPTRQANNVSTYTFIGWDKEIGLCDGNCWISPRFSAQRRYYTITFKDYNDTVISTNEYMYNDTVEVPTTPTRDQDNGYTYEFAGWDTEVVNVDKEKTYTATYTPTARTYTIEFNLNDGVLRNNYVLPKEYTFSIGVNLPDSKNLYKLGNKFVGWTLTNDKTDNVYITSIGANEYGNKIYYAQYEQVFTITTISESQTVKIKTSNLKNGVDLTDLFIAEKDGSNKVLIEGENVSIEFDNNAVKQLGAQNELILKFETGNVDDYENCYLVLALTVNDKQFSNGNATITYDITNIKTNGKNVKVYYVDENNLLTDMNAIFTDNKVTFTTNHFSTYIIAEVNEFSITSIILISFAVVVTIGVTCVLIKFLVKRKKINKKI